MRILEALRRGRGHRMIGQGRAGQCGAGAGQGGSSEELLQGKFGVKESLIPSREGEKWRRLVGESR